MNVLDQLRAALARAERVAEGLRQAITPLEQLETESLAEVTNGRLIAAPRGQADEPRGETRGGRTRAARVSKAGQARSARPVGAGEKGRPATPPPAPGEKVCTKCKKPKPVTAFTFRRKSADGRHYQCKACVARYLREARASKTGKPVGKPRKPTDEEPEPVRADQKRCQRCKNVKARAEFFDEIGVERAACPPCLEYLRNRATDGLPEVERAARVARIAARVAARGRRRAGPWKGKADQFVRCLLTRRPEGVADVRLRTGAELVCGAVVFAGDEADHLDDVHAGGAGKWEPVADVDDEMEAA